MLRFFWRPDSKRIAGFTERTSMAVDSERYLEDTSAYISGERALIIPDASRTVAEATGSPLLSGSDI